VLSEIDVQIMLKSHVRNSFRSQQEAADKFGVSRQQIIRVLTGLAKPNQAMLDAINVEHKSVDVYKKVKKVKE